MCVGCGVCVCGVFFIYSYLYITSSYLLMRYLFLYIYYGGLYTEYLFICMYHIYDVCICVV